MTTRADPTHGLAARWVTSGGAAKRRATPQPKGYIRASTATTRALVDGDDGVVGEQVGGALRRSGVRVTPRGELEMVDEVTAPGAAAAASDVLAPFGGRRRPESPRCSARNPFGKLKRQQPLRKDRTEGGPYELHESHNESAKTRLGKGHGIVNRSVSLVEPGVERATARNRGDAGPAKTRAPVPKCSASPRGSPPAAGGSRVLRRHDQRAPGFRCAGAWAPGATSA